MKLQKFQIEFEKAVACDSYDTIVLSGPRSLGKTFLAARVLTRCLTPGDSLHQLGREYVLGAASLEQARLTYGFIREWLDDGLNKYRVLDSATFGLVNVPLAVRVQEARARRE